MVTDQTGSVEQLIDLGAAPKTRRAIVRRPTDSALVLGSTQSVGDLDDAALLTRGLRALKRRSGGGGVLVGPGAQVWVDLFVPADDVLYEHDVARAAHFVGELWQAVFDTTAPESDYRIVVGRADRDDWSKRVCFAGIGPGEVCRGARKLVGVSQRRSREGAWFFTMAMRTFDAGLHAALLAREGADESALRTHLEGCVATLSTPAETVTASMAVLLSDHA